jgi:hypothetical protein
VLPPGNIRGEDPRKLEPFLVSGRKLILYQRYSDGFISTFRTIQFYADWGESGRAPKRRLTGAAAR